MLDHIAERLARRPSDGVPTRGRYLLGPVLGWLVLMTIWGFGRSGWPDAADMFLAVGIGAGGATTVLSWRRTAHLRSSTPEP